MLLDGDIVVEYVKDIINLEDVPDSLSCTQLKISNEAGIFMFPLNSIRHPIEGPVNFLAYARIKQGNPLVMVYDTGEVQAITPPALKDTLVFFFTCHTFRPCYPSYTYHVPMDMSMDLDTIIENRGVTNFTKGTFK